MNRAGYSLAEVIVSSTLLGVTLAAALTAVGGARDAGRIAANRERGAALASALMAEITALRFAEAPGAAIGRDAGESDRDDFDDVDDFNGFAPPVITLPDGRPVDWAAGWAWRSTVSHADVTNPGGGSSIETGLKRVEVAVTDPRGRVTLLAGLRARGGIADTSGPLDTFRRDLVTVLVTPPGAARPVALTERLLGVEEGP